MPFEITKFELSPVFISVPVSVIYTLSILLATMQYQKEPLISTFAQKSVVMFVQCILLSVIGKTNATHWSPSIMVLSKIPIVTPEWTSTLHRDKVLQIVSQLQGQNYRTRLFGCLTLKLNKAVKMKMFTNQFYW